MAAKRKSKQVAEPTKPVFRPPTLKGAEALTRASNRISKPRKRVQVTVKVSDGACGLGQPHSDGPGWSAQMTDAFGTTSDDFSHLLLNQVMNALSVSQSSQPQT